MDSKYGTYIMDRIIEYNGQSMRGYCHSESELMVARFPELRLVRGFYIDIGSGVPFPHWWCQLDSEIIDPTLSQFSGIEGRYEEFDPAIHGPEPIGKCYDCGELIYPPADGSDPYSYEFCNTNCSFSFKASL